MVGQPDSPPLPGFSSGYLDNFRIDKTPPADHRGLVHSRRPLHPAFAERSAAQRHRHLLADQPVSECRRPGQSGQFGQSHFNTPSLVNFPALNPITAANISNYSLINTTLGNANESSFIATAAFTAGPAVLGGTATNQYVEDYTGQIALTFLTGLPAGVYEFVAHTTELQYPGLTDAAGNPLDDTSRSRPRGPRISSSTLTSSPRRSTSPTWRSRAPIAPMVRQ